MLKEPFGNTIVVIGWDDTGCTGFQFFSRIFYSIAFIGNLKQVDIILSVTKCNQSVAVQHGLQLFCGIGFGG